MLRTVYDYSEEYQTEDLKRHILNLLKKVYPLPKQSDSLIIAMDDILNSESRDGKPFYDFSFIHFNLSFK